MVKASGAETSPIDAEERAASIPHGLEAWGRVFKAKNRFFAKFLRSPLRVMGGWAAKPLNLLVAPAEILWAQLLLL